MQEEEGKLIIFSAPSGSGKTTIVKHLLETSPSVDFSISATTRSPRGKEVDGKDYYFLSKEDFEEKIKKGEFAEYEEVYSGVYYGTLINELKRIWATGKHVVFDVDVVGGVNLKKHFGKQALAIFVRIPSLDVLEKRLRDRGTDDDNSIKTRLSKVEEELAFESEFDVSVINDVLSVACKEVEELVDSFTFKKHSLS